MSNKKYVRTDKNGTKIYHDYTCPRCGGRGGNDAWTFTGWTCYECGGTGTTIKPQVIKEYTPEYREKLNEQAEKRRAKKIAQAQAEKGPKQAEWKQSKGFCEDRIHVVTLEDSYSKRDAIKTAGGRFNGIVGWYFSEPHAEFETVELTAEECLIEDEWGALDWRSTVREIAESKCPKRPESEHIGAVGDKIDIDVTLTHTGRYDTRFGTTWVHTFKDGTGNVLVWKTGSCAGFESDTLHITGTVKEHDEYKGVKQTVLTRCKIA